MITLTDSQFYPNKTWSSPLDYDIPVSIQHPEWVDMFDQNGYRLTKLESHCAGANSHPIVNHRHEVSLRQNWFVDEKPLTGAHLNHAYLFERKGYEGEALEQLKEYAQENNSVYKLINYVGKWGVDFSMDFVNARGNSMELLHFEYDSYNLREIQDIKGIVEEIVVKVDWEAAARYFTIRKYEWINLEFFEQSKYKTDYFGLPAERFKINAWE
jgi:hypothetical protein